MAYVLEVISKDGKIKYINSAKATVYVRNMPHGMTTRKLL